MSFVVEFAEDLESAARYALIAAKAVEVCPIHHDVLIRVGDDDAERHAYALATTILNSNGEQWKREDLMPAIKDTLDMAADGECPECAYLADS